MRINSAFSADNWWELFEEPQAPRSPSPVAGPSRLGEHAVDDDLVQALRATLAADPNDEDTRRLLVEVYAAADRLTAALAVAQEPRPGMPADEMEACVASLMTYAEECQRLSQAAQPPQRARSVTPRLPALPERPLSPITPQRRPSETVQQRYDRLLARHQELLQRAQILQTLENATGAPPMAEGVAAALRAFMGAPEAK